MIKTKEHLVGEIRHMVVNGLVSDLIAMDVKPTAKNIVDIALESISEDVPIAKALFSTKNIKYYEKAMEYYTWN